jgi:hypothetical protein
MAWFGSQLWFRQWYWKNVSDDEAPHDRIGIYSTSKIIVTEQ